MDAEIKTVYYFPAAVFSIVVVLAFTPVKADTLQPPPPSTIQDSTGIKERTAADSFPLKINKIYVNGNRVTRADIIRTYIGLTVGMDYDSVLVAAGKRRLLNTNLFSKVDVVPIRKHEGVDVYIIVTELFYLYPEGGGDYIWGKYGDINKLWYRLRLGLSIQNFRGSFETFSIRTCMWEDRSLSLSWSKPFSPSPYFLGIGAGVRDYPDINFPWRRFVANGRLTGGRTMYGNSRLWLSFVPTYSRINSVDEKTNLNKFEEIYSAVSWSTDRRDRSFDPSRGWSVYTGMLTNALCSDYNRYVQLDDDLRLYRHGFFSGDKFATRLQTVIRLNDGGIYKGLYTGGEGTIRGFAQDQIGLPNSRNNFAVMNDYVVGSAEYRFPLWTMPSFDVWLLSDYSDMLKNFYTRFDGAVFMDAGHIWHDLAHPMTKEDNGTGFGAGIRIMAPPLRRSVCFDVAWGAIPRSSPARLIFLCAPSYYLYLDMYY
jgi:outer membrane protein assembly factor BamA